MLLWWLFIHCLLFLSAYYLFAEVDRTVSWQQPVCICLGDLTDGMAIIFSLVFQHLHQLFCQHVHHSDNSQVSDFLCISLSRIAYLPNTLCLCLFLSLSLSLSLSLCLCLSLSISHPSVFMEAYFRNRLAPLFFIIYLFITLYFFSNVVRALSRNVER